jgi:eukaryotic-like serine/threonine-protein kinase
MSLSAGARLGPYEILSALGEGGMGEVYRARDTRLERIVAIKVLTTALAGDPQLRERFEREARAISSLNHPHICTLFDVGHQDGVDFLILEYLDGETLAARVSRGGGTAVDPNEALTIAIDICGALDTAHRAGIIHRDLKPANVMLTKAGAKLLDFGLAKSATPAVAASGLSMLPTTPPNLTVQGTILGTFQYMAPEQIEGLEADARTDVFAFGALLFEMLTGRPAFEGKTRASLLGAILKDVPPPVSHVRPLAPVALDRIISTCLAKDPDDRYQSARDLRRDLQWVVSGSSVAADVRTATAPGRSNRVAWVVAAASVIALLATVILTFGRAGDVTPAASPVQFTIVPPDKASFGAPRAGGTGIATQVTVSPDGRNVVFVAGARDVFQMWLRPIATLAATPIPGTEGGSFPFWSPDSKFIGFFADGKLKKVQIAGGPPTVLCDAPAGRGGTWSRDNVIVFSPGGAFPGLQRVSSAGGSPTGATTLDPTTGETSHRWPYFLPDGHHFLYTASTGTCCPPTKPAIIRIGSSDRDAADVTLLQAESSVLYASGHVLFARSDTLMAQPFDPDARQSTGDPFPLAERVSTEGSRYMGVSVSENGTLVYAQGGTQGPQQLTWFDRDGRALGTVGEPAPYNSLALSPDERRVAVGLGTGTLDNRDIWIIDIARTLRSRLTFDPGADVAPVWSPDGTRVAFAGQRSGKISLRQQSINGTAGDELLVESSGDFVPSDWSADGRFIAYTDRTSTTTADIWVLPLFGDRKPFPVAQTAFTENFPAFSPDGRWIAYVTNEANQGNVYVQSFPEAKGKYQVSLDGGARPLWRGDGKELFYIGPDGAMMAVSIDASRGFEAGLPQRLFTTNALNNQNLVYAVTKDGMRFLVNSRPEQASVAPITVIVNWMATIQK